MVLLAQDAAGEGKGGEPALGACPCQVASPPFAQFGSGNQESALINASLPDPPSLQGGHCHQGADV